MRVSVFHPGTQYSHQLVGQLNRLGLLYRFVTGLAFRSEDLIIRSFPTAWKRRLANRTFPFAMRSEKLVRIPIPELVALAKLSLQLPMEPVLQRRNQLFQEAVPDRIISDSGALIGFDTSSWNLAARAQFLQIPFYLDQSIGHPADKRLIFGELRSKYPEWAEDIVDKKTAYFEREMDEHRLATKIVVASSFTRDSLIRNGISAKKIIVNPYGVGPNFFRDKKIIAKQGGKFRLVYLGYLGARKGLPFLIETWNKFELHRHAEIWLAGPATPFAIEAVKQTPGMTYWGRLPHQEIPNLLSECGGLIFPSFYEGFGQVILEAMASGLPVITTEATAGPDIIEHQVDGWLFPAGNSAGLAEAVLSLAGDHSMVGLMGEKARQKAKSFSWESYGDRWERILREFA